MQRSAVDAEQDLARRGCSRRSGSGKSVLIVKYACDHLIRARDAAQVDGHVLPDLAVVAHSEALQRHLVHELCCELGGDAVRFSGRRRSAGEVRVKAGSTCVVVASIDALTKRLHPAEVVSESSGPAVHMHASGRHCVFAPAISPHPGPAPPRRSGNVGPALRRSCIDGRCRIHHCDCSYRSPPPPAPSVAARTRGTDFLTHVVQSPATVRDVATKFSRDWRTRAGRRRIL